MSRFTLALTVALFVAADAHAQTTASPTAPAMPQGQEEMMKMMIQSAHNQLGVLEYCQQQGFTGPEPVATQQKILGMMPPAQVDGLDEAEAAGKRGEVQFGGNKVQLADAAKAKNTTADAMCKQIATMLAQQAAMLPK